MTVQKLTWDGTGTFDEWLAMLDAAGCPPFPDAAEYRDREMQALRRGKWIVEHGLADNCYFHSEQMTCILPYQRLVKQYNELHSESTK